MPLQNVNGDISVDFLRYALADEIANVLTYTRTLDVRPSWLTQKYSGNNVDPAEGWPGTSCCDGPDRPLREAGRELLVTLEAIDVHDDRLLWQTSFTAPAQDLIALQSDMAAQIRSGLAASPGNYGRAGRNRYAPKNPEAYDLYLHALALSHDPGPNKDAIAVLQHVVEMDPDYAPAWGELGYPRLLRCHLFRWWRDDVSSSPIRRARKRWRWIRISRRQRAS